MRKWVLLCAFAGFLFAGAAQADTAALIINGYPVESREYVIEDGVTMVSENFMRDELHLSVTRNQNEVTFFNDEIGFTVRMSVGDTAYFLNDDEKAFPRAVAEKEGTVYLPLRAFAENFGEVHWDEAQRGIGVYYDYNKMISIPAVTMDETPILYEPIVDAGVLTTNAYRPVTEDPQGVIWEERDDQNWLRKVHHSDQTLIQPIHEGYGLESVYGINDDFVYWIEYPLESLNSQWYLYIQSREDNTKAECVDEGNYKILKQIPYGTYILDNICYSNGRIAYLYCTEGKNLEVRFYDVETGQVKVLDCYSMDEFPNGSMEVALNDRMVVWRKLMLFYNGGEYGTLYNYDIASQQVKPFYEGCNLTAPILTDQYLLVRNKPKGQNFLFEDGKMQSGEIWAYSLEDQCWRCKIDNSLPIAAREYVVAMPVVLDERNITMMLEPDAIYEMPIINLDKRSARIVKNHDGEPLQYCPIGVFDNTVATVHLTGTDQLYYAKIRRSNGMSVQPMWIYTE